MLPKVQGGSIKLLLFVVGSAQKIKVDSKKVQLIIVGYTDDDVSYRWTTGRGVNIASDMKLSQFDLISTPTGNETTTRSKGEL